MDFLISYVEINEKKYKLQHPGNREVLRLMSECTDPATGKPSLEPLMDFCFEHVVIPSGHSFKPTLDNLHPKEFEEWLEILPGFLRRGDMDGRGVSEEGADESRKAGAA